MLCCHLQRDCDLHRRRDRVGPTLHHSTKEMNIWNLDLLALLPIYYIACATAELNQMGIGWGQLLRRIIFKDTLLIPKSFQVGKEGREIDRPPIRLILTKMMYIWLSASFFPICRIKTYNLMPQFIYLSQIKNFLSHTLYSPLILASIMQLSTHISRM